LRDVNESKWNACVTFAVSSSPKRNKSRLLKIYFPVFPEILTIYFDDFPEILTIYEILLFWSESRLGEISGHNRLSVTFGICKDFLQRCKVSLHWDADFEGLIR